MIKLTILTITSWISEKGFFEVQELKSEKEKLSLFFEKCKVKKNAFTLFREVKSEIKMLRDREVKFLKNS